MPRTHTRHLSLAPVDAAPAPVVVPERDEHPNDAVGFAEACRRLGAISEWQLRLLVKQGKVKALQAGPGCRMFFRLRDLWAYLDSLER